MPRIVMHEEVTWVIERDHLTLDQVRQMTVEELSDGVCNDWVAVERHTKYVGSEQADTIHDVAFTEHHQYFRSPTEEDE